MQITACIFTPPFMIHARCEGVAVYDSAPSPDSTPVPHHTGLSHLPTPFTRGLDIHTRTYIEIGIGHIAARAGSPAQRRDSRRLDTSTAAARSHLVKVVTVTRGQAASHTPTDKRDDIGGRDTETAHISPEKAAPGDMNDGERGERDAFSAGVVL